VQSVRKFQAGAAAVALVAGTFMATGTGPARASPNPNPNPTVIAPNDWPMYGLNAQRTFNPKTTLTPVDVATLVPKWSFPTGDAVTAEPIVVAGTVYVGSWDGHFYALDAVHGALRWKFTVDGQPAVYPHVTGRTLATFKNTLYSDGGIITSTATFVPGAGARPDLVVFGAGYTLYALRAAGTMPTGVSRLDWKHAYTGRPDQAPNPGGDQTRIFSSPIVVGNQVLFGTTTDGERGERGYFVSADLATGQPQWIFETDVDTTGKVMNDGCNGVWASPTLDAADGLVFFGVADCHNLNPPPYSGRLVALHVADGQLAWVFTPARLDNADLSCDFDIGASANYGKLPDGTPFLGVGSKDPAGVEAFTPLSHLLAG
jgi:outer membrane protein assembly factor BamB